MKQISTTILWILSAGLSITHLHAQPVPRNTGLLPGAAVLFKNITTKLTVADRNGIYTLLGLRLSKSKKQFVGKDDKEEASPYMEIDVYPTDLNKDGNEEAFVVLTNPAIYGQTGAAILLFVKDASGHYRKTPEIPAADLVPLPTGNLGYPDMLLGAAGTDYGVWRWGGHQYNFYKNIKEDQVPKDGKGLAEISKAYQASIRK